MCDFEREFVSLLIKALSTLALKFPFSASLKCAISRDFLMISQREAYDILRYLLNACGQVVELNDNSFAEGRWKSVDPEVKRRIEKCKRYIFCTIENMRKENKVSIPKLKKSDLPVPYSLIYFSSCLALANYALSYQLQNHGIYFWPRIEGYKRRQIFYSNLKEDESHEFEIKQKKLLNEIETLESALRKLKELKTEVDSLLDNEIVKSKYSCALQDKSERDRILLSWKDESDELHKRNIDKIKILEDLNEQSALLGRLLVKKEKFVISGDELRKNIPFEVENFAEMNGFPLMKENHLDIPALFKIVHLSIPKTIKNREILRELLSLKRPVIDGGLLPKLEKLKKILEERCEDFHRHIGPDVRTEASAWLKNFLFFIPKVEFNALNAKDSSGDPVFDEEKLLRFREPSEKSSRHKKNNNELVSKKGYILHRFRDFTTKYCKTKFLNNSNQDNEMAPKKDSKKLLKRIEKRKSISLINLSSVSATSIKSSKSEKVDSPCGSETSRKLCSTPKENHSRSSLIYDRNISPISVISGKDKSFISQPRVPDMSVANDSTLNESDLHASLLNSYLSTDLDYKSERKQDTFDYTQSTVNVTFDSTPSGMSINLSNVSNFLS